MPHLHSHTISRRFLHQTMLLICDLVTSGYKILIFQTHTLAYLQMCNKELCTRFEACAVSTRVLYVCALLFVRSTCDSVRVRASAGVRAALVEGKGEEVKGVGGVGEVFSWPLSPLWSQHLCCHWLTSRHCQ